ncbi:ATP-binding cassette sub-family B member 8, mitochondrial [Zancudomyces culisetae]|uniref:Mitochondrial potassium channel ATP-binding subunit n=1 Tax=Zancudomyces culisetae TaxID=1213189 RepID=A0A1R1PMF6_ZANCU|nr:ATP-binding cassette sub-family B member 8, mitochondrial [Zancudomyces culisetae]|eukprot:OMH82062.1 ATP-binding cassette sub-family B member 8, mitochondrial [Zancudomyces culisetae]
MSMLGLNTILNTTAISSNSTIRLGFSVVNKLNSRLNPKYKFCNSSIPSSRRAYISQSNWQKGNHDKNTNNNNNKSNNNNNDNDEGDHNRKSTNKYVAGFISLGYVYFTNHETGSEDRNTNKSNPSMLDLTGVDQLSYNQLLLPTKHSRNTTTSNLDNYVSSRIDILHNLYLKKRRRRNNIDKGQQQLSLEDGSSTGDVFSDTSSFGSLSNIYKLIIAPEAKLLTTIVVTTLCLSAVNLYIPKVTGDLITVISSKLAGVGDTTMSGMIDEILPPAKMLAGLFLGNGLLTLVNVYLLSAYGERISIRTRLELFDNIMNRKMTFFDQKSTTELISRLTSEVNEFKSQAKLIVGQGIKAVSITAGSVYQLFRISNRLTLFLIGSTGVMYLSLWIYGKLLIAAREKSKQINEMMHSIITEAIENSRVIKGFGNTYIEYELLKRAAEENQHQKLVFGFHMGVFRALSNISVGVLMINVLLFGGRLVMNGEISGGNLMSYLMNVQNTERALVSIGELLGQFIKMKGNVGRISELLDEKVDSANWTDQGNSDKNNRAHTVPNKNLTSTGLEMSVGASNGASSAHTGERMEFNDSIRFEDVWFSYATRPEHKVLKGFNLEIKKGMSIALCGKSGSGKTTISQLIQRLYTPDSGTIYIDDVPLQDMDLQTYRNSISIIEQNPVLFTTSVLENLRYSNLDASHDQVVEACRIANCLEFIEGGALSNGFDTVITKDSLSGGQKQRIAIARAILRNPKLLILDEATASLDAQNEKYVVDAIDNLVNSNITVLIIAHKLNTVKNADLIVVLGTAGQIVEMGTHDELMRLRNHYYDMVNTD